MCVETGILQNVSKCVSYIYPCTRQLGTENLMTWTLKIGELDITTPG